MLSADSARKKFFDELKKELDRQNNPFYYTRRDQYAIINRASSNFVLPCLSLEFLWKYKTIRVGIYIQDDVYLYNKLHEIKDEIEYKLGFSCKWIDGVKNPNSKRICTYINVVNDNDFTECINESVDKVISFVNTFHRYINC